MIQSVKRAFEILECINQNGNLVRLNDIATSLNLKKTTVHNLLDTLKQLGYVEQDALSPRYRITTKFQCLYFPAISVHKLRSDMKPVLQELTNQTRETSYLAMQMGSYFRYELKCEPERSVRISLEMGKEFEMMKTAIGKIFMAHSEHLPAYFLGKLPEAEAEKLKEEIALVRQQGFAYDFEEYEPDLNCTAIPLFQNHRVIAVLGVSGPAYRFKNKEMKAAVQKLQHLAKKRKLDQ
ncbi:IclR family transcriptional regulator [Rapidithrix thailandica]|uniref:IclR family transcriptional regulator n=1 Tax=Rapidithrix thailandica TaxID=413964 RepID=A0AAW9SBH3_9BACT